VGKDQSGFGLAEFVVAVGLFAILATLIVITFSNFTRTLTRDRVATTNTNIAAVAMDELTRVIRAATSIPVYNSATDLPAFSYANKEKVILYAFIDTGSGTPKPIKVQFEVVSSRDLVETRWAAHPVPGHASYWEFDSTAQSTRVIARKIVTPGSGEAFMFNYQSIGADLLPDDMTIPVGGIAAGNLQKIAVVEVTVKVQSDTTGRADPVTMTNQVGIPNLGVSRLALS
jgi:type II secretory pathway pseudopilin PulG